MQSGAITRDARSAATGRDVQAAPVVEQVKSKGIGRILVPTDFTAYSDIALRLAIDLAKQQNATVDLLHVTKFGGGEKELRMMQGQIARFREARDIEIVQNIRKGRIPEEILNAEAEAKPDLIIMARHREGDSLFSLLRSITAKVRKRARCSVLVVGA